MRSITTAGLLLVGGLAIITSPVVPAAADHGGPHCDELPANITPDHPDWHPSLDADGDGIGCDDESQPTPTTAPLAPEPEPPTEPAPPPAEPVAAEPSFTG
ncbi:MAG: excalibur calcium-binding domain-containing protein [Acidimicrobiales bacterium]